MSENGNPDVIECANCHGDIYHDEYLFFVSQGFNCHGSAMGLPDGRGIAVCMDCAPSEIHPPGWGSKRDDRYQDAGGDDA